MLQQIQRRESVSSDLSVDSPSWARPVGGERGIQIDIASFEQVVDSSAPSARYLLPVRNKASKRKTPVMKKTLNPHYNHTFVYNGVRLEDLQHMCLELTVWDQEPLASNDFLGGVRLGVGTGESLSPTLTVSKASQIFHSEQTHPPPYTAPLCQELSSFS